jgi:hypothetical protein
LKSTRHPVVFHIATLQSSFDQLVEKLAIIVPEASIEVRPLLFARPADAMQVIEFDPKLVEGLILYRGSRKELAAPVRAVPTLHAD